MTVHPAALYALLALQAPQPEAWYKIIAGIIAIPTGLVGVLLSYSILRKTTLESRKLERELAGQTAVAAPVAAGSGLSPALQESGHLHRAVLLVVRFVVLELTLRLWNFIPSVVGYVTAGALYVNLWLNQDRPEQSVQQVVLATGAPQVIRLVFDIVYWLMVFGFGWPLLKDTCSFLGIRVESLFDLPGMRRWGRAPQK